MTILSHMLTCLHVQCDHSLTYAHMLTYALWLIVWSIILVLSTITAKSSLLLLAWISREHATVVYSPGTVATYVHCTTGVNVIAHECITCKLLQSTASVHACSAMCMCSIYIYISRSTHEYSPEHALVRSSACSGEDSWMLLDIYILQLTSNNHCDTKDHVHSSSPIHNLDTNSGHNCD